MNQSVFGTPTSSLPTTGNGLITNAEINSYFQTRKPADKIQARQQQDIIAQREFQLISDNPLCPAIRSSGLDPRRVNTTEYANLVKNEFYNPDVMRAATCVADGIIAMADNPGKYDQMRQWLKELVVVGEPSANGMALVASTGLPKDNRVIIAKISLAGKEDLIHEYFVGLVLGELRQYIPSFAMMLGAFKCSPPIVIPSTYSANISASANEAITYCEANNKVNYILMENINPSISLAEFSRTAKPEDWLNAYYQVELALRLAFKIYQLTHYDLHAKNVWLRQLSKQVVIPFQGLKDLDVLIKSNFVSTLIDYGAAHIRLKNVDYGNASELTSNYGVSYNVPFPMYDSYKLLMSCAYEATKAGNKQTVELMSVIFKFFNVIDSLESAVTDSKYFYSLPPTIKLLNVNHDDLISYINDRLADKLTFIVADPGNTEVINCASGVCTKPEQIQSRLAIASEPKNLFQGPLSQNDYQRLEPEHRAEYHSLMATFGKLVPNKFEWIPMANLNQYTDQVANAVKQLDLMIQIKKYASVGKSEAKKHNDNAAADYYSNSYNNLANLSATYLESLIPMISSDMEKISGRMSSLTRVVDNGVVRYTDSMGNLISDPVLLLFSADQVKAIADFVSSAKQQLFT